MQRCPASFRADRHLHIPLCRTVSETEKKAGAMTLLSPRFAKMIVRDRQLPDIHRAPQGRRQNIILTGPCAYEVSGVKALMEAEGYPVSALAEKVPASGDVLIVALSSMPVLGWWKHQRMLDELVHNVACRVVLLVPDALREAVSGMINALVLSGDVALSVFIRELQVVVRPWAQKERGPYRTRRILSPKMLGALDRIATGNIADNKTEYSHCHLALHRLNFRSVAQFRQFIAGTEWDKERWR